MTIFLTGATGFLGSHILQMLSDQACHIVALYRNQQKISKLPNVTWVKGDVLDLEGLKEIFSQFNFTHIIHAAAFVSFDASEKEVLYDVNVNGTENLINVCVLKDFQGHFIHISSIAALGRDEKNMGEINEVGLWVDSPLNTNYAISKYRAELHVWRGQEEGLKTTVICPSVIMGETLHGESSGELFHKLFKFSTYYPDGLLNIVDVKDVVDAVSIIIENPIKSIGEKFILNAKTVKYFDFYADVAQRFNLSKPSFKITKSLLRFLYPIDYFVSILFFKKKFISSDLVKVIGNNFQYNGTKIISVLDFKYSNYSESIERIGAYYYKTLISKNK